MKTTSEFLEITAASGGRKPSVRGLAYSGGKMRLFGWSRPVVVDMAGMNIPESVPLLANHENHTLCRVGVVNASLTGGRLEISGEIVAGGELAETIVAQGRAGADWQLSIGAEVEAAELVQEGKRTVNGVEHEAPFYHVTKSTLREVSVVAVTTPTRQSVSFTWFVRRGTESGMPIPAMSTTTGRDHPKSRIFPPE